MATIVLGIGNLVRSDEGAGIHLLKALEASLENTAPIPGLELIDGGTMGLTLLEHIEKAQNLLLLDAVEAGKPPGEVLVWQGEQIPYFTASKMSVHQVGITEVLMWAKFRGHYPEEIAVVGIQPHTLAWGTDLSEMVQAALPAALAEIQTILALWP